MAYFLNFLYSAAGDKYFNCSIPGSTSNAGRPLQIEWEIEFEAKKNSTEFVVASNSTAGAANLLFLRSGTDFELRAQGNANWLVTTGVDLTNFNVFKIRSTFNGTTRTQTLHINGNLIATRSPTTGTVGAFAVIAGLNSSAARGGSFKWLKYTDFVTPANNRLYDANLSNGTGTILPESLYGLNATQGGVWPADNSEWVFYESGGGAAQHQSSSASAFQLCSAVATTSPLNSQQQNTGTGAAQVFSAAATSDPVNSQNQQTAGGALQTYSAIANNVLINNQQHQTTATAAQVFTEATQTTASNNQHQQCTGQVVSVAGFIASTSWVNTVNLGNVQNRQTSASDTQAFSAQATATKTNKQHRQTGGKASSVTTFAASSSWVNTVLQIAAYTQQIKTRSISKKHYQTSTRHSYHIKSRSNHKIELTTQSGGVYMQEINFKQGASALLVIDHQIDNEQVAGINAAKYELYGRTGQVLITKELGSGIAFNAGKIEIQLTDTDTAELSGNYKHQCVAKDLADRTFYPLNGDITFSATKPRL